MLLLNRRGVVERTSSKAIYSFTLIAGRVCALGRVGVELCLLHPLVRAMIEEEGYLYFICQF